MVRRCVLLALAACCMVAADGRLASAATAEGKLFRAGAFAADITPQKFPISVNGSTQDRQATGSHDTLHARCLVLDDGATKLAIVVCDSCAIYREVMDEAKQLAEKTVGIPGSNVLISATHTHSAPSSVSVFQSDADVDYQRHLAQQIAKGIQQAHAQLEPARLAWAVGSDPTQVFNRRWYLKEGT
ncbi:MAG TPA: neutral/alkaline non-lysosomal ceramidase N-terminal domain-containing protein, partial [Pirellulales bacterium]|nr:neutral/alkaline non-lysosomal ceramidase N-terminal domain-containing protein [Pirellulales bacterium]